MEDGEFSDTAVPSHLAASGAAPILVTPKAVPSADAITLDWAPEAQKELGKIPFFVRGKARRNTEKFAAERGLPRITIETLYDAKAHFSR